MALEFTQEEFEQKKAAAEAAYAGYTPVRCPYLNAEVAFNVKGLDHIKMKRWGHARSNLDQFMRLKLLHMAPEIIRTSRTLQGFDAWNMMERVKIHSRWETRMVRAEYYEFISVQPTPGGDKCRVRIVVKRIDQGPYFFWSIIPYWNQRDNGKRKISEGNPEED